MGHVVDRKPRDPPDLPVLQPGRKAWSVRFERLEGRFALGLWQRRPGGFVFPGQVVEKAVDVPATTRWWETLERVARLARDAGTRGPDEEGTCHHRRG